MGPGGLVSGHPSRLQKRIFGRAVGDASLTGLMPGFQVAGIAIDNPSGSWLLVEPLNSYVPPYTMAWSSPIDPPNITIEVTYPATGPGGLLSTTAGLPAVVTLYGYPVGASGGYPYIGSQQPPVFTIAGFTAQNVAQTFIVCPPNQRIRLYWATLDATGMLGDQGTTGAGLTVWHYLTGGIFFGPGVSSVASAGLLDIVPPSYVVTVNFLPFGLDGPIGANLNGKLSPRSVAAGNLVTGVALQLFSVII